MDYVQLTHPQVRRRLSSSSFDAILWCHRTGLLPPHLCQLYIFILSDVLILSFSIPLGCFTDAVCRACLKSHIFIPWPVKHILRWWILVDHCNGYNR